MDREAWRAAILGVAKSRTQLSDWTELTVAMNFGLKMKCDCPWVVPFLSPGGGGGMFMDILEHEEFLPMALRGPHSSLSCRNTHSLSLSFRTSSEAEITAPASSWEQIFKKYLSGDSWRKQRGNTLWAGSGTASLAGKPYHFRLIGRLTSCVSASWAWEHWKWNLI